MLLRFSVLSLLLACFLIHGAELNDEWRRTGSGRRERKAGVVAEVRTNRTRGSVEENKTLTPNKKIKQATNGPKRGKEPRNDAGCTRMRGICQPQRYVCQGHYVKDKCARANTRQCCMPGSGAWSVLCAGHQNNRVRGCDVFGCGAFNSQRGGGLHKAVDVVCEDYGVVNAPFSGSLAGPVGRAGPGARLYDGVKLLNSEHCVMVFNMRPYRYLGPVTQGEALGYLLPLQERFSGITSHMELQMCDQSDPSPFI